VSNSSKTCYLFTQSYPYGDGEVFIEQEIPFLAKYFQKVVVFPMDNERELRELPNNVEVKSIFNNMLEEYSPKKVLLQNFIPFCKVMLKELYSNPLLTILNIKNLSTGLLQNFYRASILRKEIDNDNNNETVFYSYWFDAWAIILGILKNQNRINQFVSRAHAFDIYEEDNVNGIIPFRTFQLRQVNRVFAVSNHGKDYLRHKYKNYADKIEKAWLGKALNEEVNPFSKSLTIVSCGSVQNRKRIVEIPEILRHLNIDFKWVHFGDGDEMSTLKEKIKDCKLEDKVELKGHVTNSDFTLYLKTEPVSFFLSVSRNEGLPFTMIESLSYGIPIIATDAMGCRDIINEQTGILLPVFFQPTTVAKQIEEFAFSAKNTDVFRSGVKAFWKQNFEAEKNYFEFYKLIN
jgi:glycosyltransferase involved in cell wall biosynthesis